MGNIGVCVSKLLVDKKKSYSATWVRKSWHVSSRSIPCFASHDCSCLFMSRIASTSVIIGTMMDRGVDRSSRKDGALVIVSSC
jgi:hypothetical protein